MSDVTRRIEQWLAALNGSELLSHSDVTELEAHLREEMEHLRTAGLSDEEAFLVARRRLGDPASLEQEYAKVSPFRRLSSRLSWMATGVLAYYLALYVSMCLTNASTVLGYTVGLRNPYLTLLACTMHLGAFAGIGALLWRYLVSHWTSRATVGSTSISVRIGLLAACVVAALSFFSLFSRSLLFRILPMESVSQIALAEGWVTSIWFTFMPFLLAGLIAVLAVRNRRRAQPE